MNEAINQIEIVQQEVMSVPDRAKLIIVKDQQSLQNANLIFLDIKGLRKKIEEVFSPIIQAAHKTHQEAIAQRKKVEEPLIVAENYLNGQVTDYNREQRRIREEEMEKLRLQAIKEEFDRRKKEEEDRISQAIALEEVGAYEEAESLISETIEEKEKPMEVVVPPPETPKVKLMGAAMRESWDFEIEKESLIPRQYLIPDLKKIGGMVRALKGETNIPGIKVFRVDKMVATGR
jgi:hypothetical protein